MRLGWALTVHKAQGMTLSRVELNLQCAFEYGQVYTALSRATSLDGLWLRSYLLPTSIRAHPKVLAYYSTDPIALQDLAGSCTPEPRFDDFSGSLDVDLFQKSYAFLDEYRETELENLKKEMTSLRRKGRKKGRMNAQDQAFEADLTKEMQQRVQQDKQRRHLGEMRSAELSLKGEERKRVRETGKKPYFHSKGAVRQLVIQKRKQEKKGEVRDMREEKREKKMAGRDKKKIPVRRNRESEA